MGYMMGSIQKLTLSLIIIIVIISSSSIYIEFLKHCESIYMYFSVTVTAIRQPKPLYPVGQQIGDLGFVIGEICVLPLFPQRGTANQPFFLGLGSC